MSSLWDETISGASTATERTLTVGSEELRGSAQRNQDVVSLCRCLYMLWSDLKFAPRALQ